jgi:hypothetical protein
MNAGTPPIKTAQGQAELSTRARRLGQRHRTLLLLVDGRRSEAQVLALAAQVGVARHCFDELVVLGLIEPSHTYDSLPIAAPAAAAEVLHIALPLGSTDSALLPLAPSRTLQPDSIAGESLATEAWLPSDHAQTQRTDPEFAEARVILMREVRAQAPVTGSLTLLRLRRASTRADLAGLLAEVEMRLRKPHRSVTVDHTLARVRQLLGERADSKLAPV